MSWLTDLVGFNAEEAQKTSEELDKKLMDLNVKQLAEGKITRETFNESLANIEKGKINAEGEVAAAFWQSINENPINPKNVVTNVASGAGKFLWHITPKWLLIGAAVFAFFYFGGLKLVAALLPKK